MRKALEDTVAAATTPPQHKPATAAFGELQERLARKLLPLFAKAADIVVEN